MKSCQTLNLSGTVQTYLIRNHPLHNSLNVMFWAIWYHLYNLKNVKNTNGEVLLLVKLQPFYKAIFTFDINVCQ